MTRLCLLLIFIFTLGSVNINASDKVYGGNVVTLLPSGKEKFNDLFQFVQSAKKSIHMEYFNVRNDCISNILFELLKERAAAGVEVRIIFDGLANAKSAKPLNKSTLDSLRSAGIEIYEFDPIRFPWVNHIMCRDHRKIVVIDGQVAYTGGMNVADYYIVGNKQVGEWHDMHLRIEGPAVEEFQGIFLRLWNKLSKQQVYGAQYYPGEYCPGDTYVKVVNSEENVTPRNIRRTFEKLIKSSRTSLTINNPYFAPTLRIRRSLYKALRRGVDVRILVSEKGDVNITHSASEFWTHRLMKRGANVFIYQGGFHHSKVMTIDDSLTYVGSANLDFRSLMCDYECNVLISTPEKTMEFRRLFEEDVNTRCYRLTQEEWKKKPLRKRYACWWAHLFTPVL